MRAVDDRWLPYLAAAVLLAWCAGMLGRGFWTPDEPREADIAWRMSWQDQKSVPVLAGDPFCEKPPLTYWAAALPVKIFGPQAWAARLPNLLYAVLTALSVGMLGRRLGGARTGWIAAAAVSTFLLAYQVAIWFATDAPLLAFVSLALLGLHQGFYGSGSAERLRGYTLMHGALALCFLSKSAFGWMVPALTLASLIVWERRWRELLRWELYAGLLVQAALILTWVWNVYVGPDGLAHLKVFFWNNLAGRLTQVDAPAELQYASGHRNSPGKYFLELPLYLWPWTLLVLAAIRRAWQQRRQPAETQRAVRFALAASLPSVLLLSLAATARNVYLGPTMPGFALLLAAWAADAQRASDDWDRRFLRGTVVFLAIAAILAIAVLVILTMDADAAPVSHALTLALGATGIAICIHQLIFAWRRADRGPAGPAVFALFFAFCALLTGPTWFAYEQIDRWQNLGQLGAQIRTDTAGRPLFLWAPDETTQAMVDLYVSTTALPITERTDPERLHTLARLGAEHPGGRVLVQVRGRAYSALIARLSGNRADADDLPPPFASLQRFKRYELPNGRRYALLEAAP